MRPATPDDLPALDALIAASSRQLARDDYTREQIEAAIGTAWGVDTQLIRDRTYFVVLGQDRIVGCGGWSKRRTLFGADGQAGRDAALLDPATDAARIRAFFVDPACARQGIGRMLLGHCEAQARAAGFKAAELIATLPGVRLYAAHGYEGNTRVAHLLPGDVAIDFVPMRKVFETPG